MPAYRCRAARAGGSARGRPHAEFRRPPGAGQMARLDPAERRCQGTSSYRDAILPMSDVRHEAANKLPSSLHFEQRTYGADEGAPLGFSQYVVEPGAGLATAIELAERITGNAPMTNFAAMHVLPRNAEQDRASGLLMEALMSAIAQSDPEAKRRLHDFLEKRASKTVHR